jgi:hypothetical protein
VFRGHGNTRAPLAAALVCALVNLLLDPLLMFGPAPWLRLGLGGAAAASAVAQYAALATYAVLLRKSRTIYVGAAALEAAAAAAAQGRWAQASGTVGAGARATAATGATARLGRWAAEAAAALPVAKQILSANGALLAKTSSLMLCWAVASRCATQMGPIHAAAHQVNPPCSPRRRAPGEPSL